jgi:hypothetical protein
MRGRKRQRPEATPGELAQLIAYDPVTGIFTWKVERRGRPYGHMPIGTVAGSIYADGYRVITIDGERYNASRLAFALMMGRWPENEIDHDNRIRDDDRWDNLRDATMSQNSANRDANSNNKLGIKGVCFEAARNRYKATIEVGGRSINLGRFKTAAEARAAYLTAAQRYFGEFAAKE